MGDGMIDKAVSVGRLGLGCRRHQVPSRVIAENGLVQKSPKVFK